ncbi:MAG: glutamine ABC transporter substrate-binding protein [Alphaproteobacteria bacterium]|nr:MAG: glutamine ABC transporter substrate-binding protein [Alphaproteobacteria bacterium]
MPGTIRKLRAILAVLFVALPASAQDGALVFATVERPPFSFTQNGRDAGFSIDLMRAIAADLGQEVRFRRVAGFGEMLDLVERAEVDGAIANISITSEREQRLDFSQPIFKSGLKIMLHEVDAAPSVLAMILSRRLLVVVFGGLGVLAAAGMLMWVLERKRQPYFDRPLSQAFFPSFWWALNLVVNGGFEERMPRSIPGRLFGVTLVVSSLFVVSVFVANITAALTVDAIRSSITSINDLDGKRVGTTAGSTAASYLAARDIGFNGYESFEALVEAFEEGELDAVLFDGPILDYYVATRAPAGTRTLDRIFRSEDFGIALPEGSPLREPINRSLLRLREDGTYRRLITRWFGTAG